MRSPILLLLLALLPACSDLTGSGSGDLAGTYTMVSVNSATLPFTLQQNGNDRVVVSGGSITLTADRRFVDDTEFRVTEGGATTVENDRSEGTYTQVGKTLTLTTREGGSFRAALDGSDLAVVRGQFEVLYRRQ